MPARLLAPLLFLIPLSLTAHVVSMSTSQMTIEGAQAKLELRMPLYEIQHIKNPEDTIFGAFEFSSQGKAAVIETKKCSVVAGDGSYQCSATLRFDAPVERMEARCNLHQVTVPNHVHLLQVQNGDRTDRAVFDYSFTTADLRFVPPSAWEIAIDHFFSGAWRAVGGWPQLLFLLAVALSARSRRELWVLLATLIGAQVSVAILVFFTRWQLAAGFLESATALSIAYLAVEILLLPEAGFRPAVIGVLGAFHGAYYGMFLLGFSYIPYWFLPGVSIAAAGVVFAIYLLLNRMRRVIPPLLLDRSLAVVLLIAGLAWFFARLRA